jgi:hypothetical protein
MCNDRSTFSTFKKLSLPIVIELGDKNSVTTMHDGFVDLQGYQVEALHTPTFRLSDLLINQLDLGRHMTLFSNGKCSRTSPSSCMLAGKLINGIYIVVPVTALLSSTTQDGRMRKRDSALSRAVITEPTIDVRGCTLTAIMILGFGNIMRTYFLVCITPAHLPFKESASCSLAGVHGGRVQCGYFIHARILCGT